MTEQLKPCPFTHCGNTDIKLRDRQQTYFGVSQWAAYCFQCAAWGPVAPTPDEAARLWNSRVVDKALDRNSHSGV